MKKCIVINILFYGYERAGYERASSLMAHSPGSFITYSLKKYNL